MSSGCSVSRFRSTRRLSALKPLDRGIVICVLGDDSPRDRLASLGVTPGASVTVLQKFPGIVFECDQTELAVEPQVARAILVEVIAQENVGGDRVPSDIPTGE